jgi:hypothetical protein
MNVSLSPIPIPALRVEIPLGMS